jgi:hypothetical protein
MFYFRDVLTGALPMVSAELLAPEEPARWEPITQEEYQALCDNPAAFAGHPYLPEPVVVPEASPIIVPVLEPLSEPTIVSATIREN